MRSTSGLLPIYCPNCICCDEHKPGKTCLELAMDLYKSEEFQEYNKTHWVKRGKLLGAIPKGVSFVLERTACPTCYIDVGKNPLCKHGRLVSLLQMFKIHKFFLQLGWIFGRNVKYIPRPWLVLSLFRNNKWDLLVDLSRSMI